MDNLEKLRKLHELLDEIAAYGRSMGKLEFDLQCCAPPEGMQRAGDDMAVLGRQLHKLTHAPEYRDLVCQLHEDNAGLTDVQKKMVDHLYEEYEKTKNQSEQFAYEMSVAFNRAYGVWLEAKQKADFSLFAPMMKQTIAFTRQAIDLRDRKYSSWYSACIDDHEKGGSEQQLDAFFGALKERIVPLIRRITAEGKPIRSDFLSRPCPIPQQEKISRYLLELEGLRKTALVLMTTEHPFTTNFGPEDVRVTTHYHENSFVSNIFTTMHEGGHALFMQNEPEEFYAEHADNNMSNAMHECISRFYENLVGRSEQFIRFVYPLIREATGDTFSDVTERELYEAVNMTVPGLNRCEADELTYSLHVMIRYEIEKAFINGDMEVEQIPALWNEKYREYLGVDVPNDAEGCLQDVHWTMAYGYFPSYALGNAYGVQILRTMQKELDVYGCIEKGNLASILAWLKEHVFSLASIKDPDEWIRAITGESLNTDYYLDYLEEKFTALYEL